ncbi:hypothetical protein HII36_46915 [Nonomuraea sp. NN258]|uniref:hypothetical protein n=1 Tax=Nonomuraea antri TaxID=2730852 RepID=UPI001567CEF6|nr:hypothetical protein [Nonomuraea antri]NRQ39306.1 hypothetical protein [Nonomuraea antri]
MTWRRLWLPAVLAVATVLLGGVAAWSAGQASDIRNTSTTRNAAMTDQTRTSQVKSQIIDAVNTVFSYNHADVAKTEKAAQELLTGDAVQQYNGIFGVVREQAQRNKLVLTTTVTDSGVMLLEGDRARLLIFADQHSTAATDTGQASYAPAMFAVGAVFVDDRWKIENIDTF